MATLKLYGDKSNKNAAKAYITAEYVGLKIETLPLERGVTSKTAEFTKLNPIQKIPVLVTPDGSIFESNAIARYVARLKDMLLGSTLYEKGLVDQWCDFAATEIDANLAGFVYPKMGYVPLKGPEIEAFSLDRLKRALGALNSYLVSHTYVVGNSVTVADITIACNLTMGVRTYLDKKILSEFPHVERYYWTLVNQPEFKKVLGDISHGDMLSAITPPPKAEAKKPAAEPAKPKEAPPAAPTPAPAATAEDDEEAAPSKKPKNPLDLLPPSTMVLDNWKRLYSNTKAKDFAEVAIKGFWEMYDPEGFSLWFCDYKYNEENTVSFVTMNKVGGFLQRMDFIRKYGFGKMCILGDSPPFKIKGVWLFRGTEIPQMVKDECYDMELYEWTKVDVSDEAQKALVNAYFEEPDEINGEKLIEAKCFK